MGDRFIIQIPYNVIVEPNQYLAQINELLAGFCQRQFVEPWSFEKLYTLCVNSETGHTYVEGKVFTGDQSLEINDFEMPWTLEGVEYRGTVDRPRYVPLYTIPQCITNVMGWSKARGILDNGVWYSQATKLYEEDGEAATGISKNKRRYIMDGIGDALVVLVNLMELIKFDSTDISTYVSDARSKKPHAGNSHYLFHKMRFHLTCAVDYIWDQAGIDSAKQLEYKHFENSDAVMIECHFAQMVEYANALANAYDMTLEQCFSLAWDEIKDRKGFLNADGIFVKEADMTAAEIEVNGSLTVKDEAFTDGEETVHG